PSLGARPISYQWRFRGEPIEGETNALLKIEKVESSAAGIYTVVASNSVGVAEQSYELQVMPFVVREAPENKTVFPGEDVEFSAATRGTDLTYQWSHNGAVLPGETSSVLKIPTASFDQAGSYAVTVARLSPEGNGTDASAGMNSMVLEAALRFSNLRVWGID